MTWILIDKFLALIRVIVGWGSRMLRTIDVRNNMQLESLASHDIECNAALRKPKNFEPLQLEMTRMSRPIGMS